MTLQLGTQPVEQSTYRTNTRAEEEIDKLSTKRSGQDLLINIRPHEVKQYR